MANPVRQKRVAERIRAELSELLQREIGDPRLRLVTVTDVNIDRELVYANVFVCAVGGEERQKEVLEALNQAKGFLRRAVGARIQLRSVPQLMFHWDPTPDRGEHIAQLIDAMYPPAERKANG